MEAYNETVAEIAGDRPYWTVSTGQRYWKFRLERLAEKHKEVELVAQNADGSVVYHVPRAFVKFQAPPKRELTEEQRLAARERMKKLREKQTEEKDG